jgi:predicted nucleic acid-binding protein
MIAVDVNCLAYLWIPGEMTGLAERVLRKDPHWAAPFLWRSEFRNILATYVRRGNLTMEKAADCLRGAEEQMAGREYLVSSELVMQEIARSRCSSYDCEYAAVARHLGVKLVTSDAQVLHEFAQLAVALGAFAEGV